MTWWREPALAVGVGLEAIAVVAAREELAALAVAAHVASCGGIALGLRRRLPRGAAAPAFAMAVFVPILGLLGWIVVASVSPAVTGSPAVELVHTPIPGPEAARIHASRPATLDRLPTSDRIAAARGRDDPGAIALLRRALTDPDEDIRLVAHAVLESKLRAAYRSLHDGARALAAAPAELRATLHRRLAAGHWELAWSGLADGDCLVDTLQCARRHAQAASAEQPGCASLALLVARIELRCANAVAAEAALARAIDLGLPPAIASSYLAEAAFLERRFERVRQRLAAAPSQGSAALARVRRFWS
jgi:hypothetical protein